MFNKKILVIIFSIMFTALACGQLEIGVQSNSNTLPEPHVNTTTDQENPDSHLLSDHADNDENNANEEIEIIVQYMAYTDSITNVWILEIGSSAPRQITFDANLTDGTNTAVNYGSPQISSDGTLLAYLKEVGDPRVSGYDFTSGVWVENLVTGEKNQLLTGRTLGFSWKPDSHKLAYTTAIDNYDYWINRGQPSYELATGINLINVDNWEDIVLVEPESGYTLSGPKWTVDGRFVYFAEVINMEGSGNFAYYDLENKEFISWEEPVGKVSWSLDGNLISYARHTYSPSGEERIYIRSRQGVEELIGPEYEGLTYATHPVFSPTENIIAYLVFEEGPLTSTTQIIILDLDGGEPKSLGNFEDVWDLAWSLDGNNLIFSSGNWDSRQIILLNILDGSHSVIAYGRQISLTGQ